MSTHEVTHLETGEKVTRQAILINPYYKAEGQPASQHHIDPEVEDFHRQLPAYGETQLHSLPSIATELGFAHVFLKDESSRFGLPSFKILGASWAIHRVLCRRLELSSSTTLDSVKQALASRKESDPTASVRLVTCSEGNWGRAVARMAKYYEIPATIYVPGFMNEYTRNLIRGEGSNIDLRVLDGSYDDTIAAVQHEAETDSSALMVMDTSWPGYEEIPGWVTEGYSTLMAEVDRQVVDHTKGQQLPVVAVASVGVGSWAHSVVSHYRITANNKVITVEPVAAPSFKESLHCGEITPIKTGDTIMNGMNCGTTSTIAWPVLRDGTFAAVTVNDLESHDCVYELRHDYVGVNAGPCGAATLVALRKLCADRGDVSSEDRKNMVVVLFSTEGRREYTLPAGA
ncbi:hypothetical protein LTR56_019013 [Elasticomyces elasticus]|nr:hypothetical protein LTR56_019013 [Elasticomyces elasticus]KAK3635402.1 hypothetical protein LTR22_019210 [Elasticomyces elasticus]KAK4911793.1 hypothetical protein LTR49_019690 [Elasticomyces elasticus]KAK5751266.1 hypothetical protein LTS12_018659 [Elasticomyces elasticus]